MTRTLTIGTAILAIGIVTVGCSGSKAPEAGGTTSTAASAGGTKAPGGAKPAGLYNQEDVAMIKKAVTAYQNMVKKEMINPKGSKYKADKVDMAKDLANNYLNNVLKMKAPGFNRPLPPDAKPGDQARWIYEKEVILDGLKLVGSDGDSLRTKVSGQYGDAIKRAEANKDKINKAWRFPIRWAAE